MDVLSDTYYARQVIEIHNWTVEDVQEWLVQDVDLPQYASSFASNNIDGSVLPRLVNSTSTLMMALGIRNMHKQRLALKAMDAVLFGAPKRVHSFTKDLLLVSSLILAVGGCWFACLHHRYSQTQVKKMMKDLESLQKAEDALRKLSNELADAEKNQSSLSQEKQEELRMLRQSSVRLKVPVVAGGDKSPSALSREGSVMRRQEGEKKLKQAEEELSALREALSEAETRLELQQQLETQWSVPGELQAWLQLTHELEMQHHSMKKQAAERQRLAARDGCDKIKKRNKAFFGSLRIAHSNSLDDIEQSIMDARAALEEVRQDLQESQQRWQIMEILCGFPIIVNPGLAALRQALGRDPAGNVSRGTGSLLTPGSIDETEEDMQPAGFTASTLPSSGKSSTFLKQQTMAGSTSSLPHASTVGGGAVAGVAAGVATLPRRDSRDTDIMLSRTTEGVMGTAMGVATNATVFHLGPVDNPMYQTHERTHSNASISMISPMLSNGHHHAHQQPLRTAYSQALSHPPFHLPLNGSSQHILAAGSSTGCLTPGGVNSNSMMPHRAGTGKMFTSASGNHLSGLKQVSPSAVSASHGNKNGTSSVNGQNGFNGAAAPSRQESLDSNGNTIGYNTDPGILGSMRGTETPPISGILTRPQAQSTPADNTDRTSLDSMTKGSHSMTARNRLDRTPEVDMNSSQDTDSVYSNGQEVGTDVLNISQQDRSSSEQPCSTPTGGNTLEKKSSRRKKFLPNFLQKGKGKQKTS
ncbi:stromal interaction molecule 1-like [Elysia marginata]|uniref:Stromal interaction molecule 1-like n=1 Tax=Elysia marginata TaxID=1093978 RepID=A0AAV4ICH0_9GAST|nr:stromal interaction molecule 1-like [Elysia marginata]